MATMREKEPRTIKSSDSMGEQGKSIFSEDFLIDFFHSAEKISSKISNPDDFARDAQELIKKVEVVASADLPHDHETLANLMNTLEKAKASIRFGERKAEFSGRDLESISQLMSKIRDEGWAAYRRDCDVEGIERMPEEFGDKFLRYATALKVFGRDSYEDFIERLIEVSRYIVDHELPEDQKFGYSLVHQVKNAGSLLPPTPEHERARVAASLIGEVVYKINNKYAK